MKIIAHIKTDLPEKFGVPRQSGLADALEGWIYFEPEYRNMEAFRGLEEFSYIWILWKFDGVETDSFRATVRPPKLGGNVHKGVFATRSPFRPNPIGLSSVKLLGMKQDSYYGPVLHVSGIDLRDNTEIYDIKPYIPYADIHEDALGSFAQEHRADALAVEFPQNLLEQIPIDKRKAIHQILALDPRPAYQTDENRVYGLSYAGYNISFKVNDGTVIVINVAKLKT